MSHTQKPWVVAGDFVRDYTGLRIADCYADWKPEGRVEADARLIAAAPDLADCVEAALNMVDGDGFPPNWDWLRATLNQARQP